MKIKYLIVVKKFIFIVIFINSTILFSQGSWNLKYISIDKINNNYIDKELRLDFKSSYTDIIKGEVNVFDIRRLLSEQDTIDIEIKGEKYKFLERWDIYVDHGVLKEQKLVSINESGNNMIIREMFLLLNNDSTLTLKAFVYATCNQGKIKDKKKYNVIEILIDKSILKGVLVNVNNDTGLPTKSWTKNRDLMQQVFC